MKIRTATVATVAVLAGMGLGATGTATADQPATSQACLRAIDAAEGMAAKSHAVTSATKHWPILVSQAGKLEGNALRGVRHKSASLRLHTRKAMASYNMLHRQFDRASGNCRG